MKKATLISVTLIMTVFITCHFQVFKLFQNSQKANFRAYVSQNLNQLEQINISPFQLFSDSKNMEWLDENKEIMINGILYDIISIKNSGKTVSLFVINDTKEKALMENYSKVVNSKETNSNSSKSNILKSFLSLKFIQGSNYEFNLSSSSLINKHYTPYTVFLSDVFISQETPPPNKFS